MLSRNYSLVTAAAGAATSVATGATTSSTTVERSERCTTTNCAKVSRHLTLVTGFQS